MVPLISAIAGGLLGLVAHDLAVQSLDADRVLRPLTGTCPRCGNERRWTSARCGHCGRRIGREPLVIGAAALAAAGAANTIGLSWALVAYLGFVLLTTALLVTDIDSFRIVDRLNLRGTAILGTGLLLASVVDGDVERFARGLLGGVAYFVGAALLWLVVRGRGFGAGDVKLAVQLGLFTAYVSWGTLGWAVFATALIGGVLGVALILFGSAGLKSELPYGPPMIVGSWLAIALAGLGSFPIPT